MTLPLIRPAARFSRPFKQSMTIGRLFAGLFTLLFLAAPAVWAAKTDRNKPIDVSADRKVTDYKNGTSVYTGKVVIDQGSLHATGDKATLYVHNGQLVRAVLEGSPATFQEMDDKNQLVKGSANQANYLAQDQQIILTGNAQLLRQGDKLAAQRITYNMKDEIVQAGGSDNGGRVHVTIQPRTQSTPAEQSKSPSDTTTKP